MSAAVLARRAGRRQLSLLSSLLSAQRGFVSRSTLPALETAAAASSLPKPQAVALYNTPARPSPLAGARGFAAGSGLAGGCFIIRRVPQAAVPSLPASTDGKSPSGSLAGLRCASAAAMPQPASPGRSLSTSPSPFCNLAAGGGYSDFEEAPFGHAPSFASSGAEASGHGSESESEDDDVAVAQVGGHILYGGSRISRTSGRTARKPVDQMEARWIGSATHSGDWSRASTVKPVAAAEPTTVWGQILAACRQEPSQLKSTVAMLHAAYKQNHMAPPLPAFNKLLELCSTQPNMMDTVHQLVEIMSESGLAANDDTHKQLEACFAYNNRMRST